MICPVCFKEEATETVTREFVGGRIEGKVCANCVLHAQSLTANGFYNIFVQQQEKRCRRCGRSLNEIMQTLLLGCPHCYTDFAKQLTPLIDVLQRRDS